MARFNFTNITLSSKANIQDVMNNFNKIENLGITSNEVDTKINSAKTTITNETNNKLNNKVNKSGDTINGNLYVNRFVAGNSSDVGHFEVTNDGAVELYHSTPFIDFHFNQDNSKDYTSRIIEREEGTLTFEKNVLIKGKLTGNLTGNASSANSCSGNAGTATQLKNARTIAISGGATGTPTSFNGTNNITIPVTSLDATKLTGTASINTSGNAASATKLQNTRQINGVNFNGTSNITIKADPTVHAITDDANLNTLITPGFYYAYPNNKITNKPDGAVNFGAIIFNYGDHHICQFLIIRGNSDNSDRQFYFRESNNNGANWSNWYNFYTTLHKPSKSDVGLGNVENKSSATIRGEITSSNVTTALGFTPPPKNHASTATTYGVATSSNYGHTKIINNLTTSSHADGQALSAYQGKILNDKITNANDRITTTGNSLYDEIVATNDVLGGRIDDLGDSLKPLATTNYSYGTAAPTGGSNGDIYDQYF